MCVGPAQGGSASTCDSKRDNECDSNVIAKRCVGPAQGGSKKTCDKKRDNSRLLSRLLSQEVLSQDPISLLRVIIDLIHLRLHIQI